MYDDEKPKRGAYTSPREATCPICGAAQYEWGRPGSEGGLFFLPEGAIFGLGMGERLSARKCRECGNVQFFVRDGD